MLKETFSKTLQVRNRAYWNPNDVTLWFASDVKSYGDMKPIVKHLSKTTSKFLKARGKSDPTKHIDLAQDREYLSLLKAAISPPASDRLLDVINDKNKLERVLAKDGSHWQPVSRKIFTRKFFARAKPNECFLIMYLDETFTHTVRIITIDKAHETHVVVRSGREYRNFKYSSILELWVWDNSQRFILPHPIEFNCVSVTVDQKTEARSIVTISAFRPEGLRESTVTIK